MIISICFALGVAIGCFISFKLFSQLKWQNYRLKKKLAPEKDNNKLVANERHLTMIELLFLLLPVAAGYGWIIGKIAR